MPPGQSLGVMTLARTIMLRETPATDERLSGLIGPDLAATPWAGKACGIATGCSRSGNRFALGANVPEKEGVRIISEGCFLPTRIDVRTPEGGRAIFGADDGTDFGRLPLVVAPGKITVSGFCSVDQMTSGLMTVELGDREAGQEAYICTTTKMNSSVTRRTNSGQVKAGHGRTSTECREGLSAIK